MENIIAEWRVKGLIKADPQKVYKELRDHCEDVGEAKPEQIVEWAKDSGCELHKCFDWNDDIAAVKWRLHQAVQLTSNLVFKREVSDDGVKAPAIRIFNKTDNGGYKVPERVFKVQSEHDALLQRAWAELRRFKEKYSSLQELDYILELID